VINKYLKSYKTKTRQSLLRLSVFFTPLYFLSQVNASVINESNVWDRLFFQKKENTEIFGKVFAINLSGPKVSTVIASDNNIPLFLYIGDTISFSGKSFILKSITQDGVFFEDNQKKSYFLSLTNDLSRNKIKAKNINKGNIFNNRKNKKRLPIRGPMYSVKEVPEALIKEIVTETGLPLKSSNLIAKNIIPARSNGGRPGWKIKEVPLMFEKLGVNLRSGDIILSVDGVPAQNILKIKNHLKERKAGQVFKVEIQRDGKLVLLEFSE